MRPRGSPRLRENVRSIAQGLYVDQWLPEGVSIVSGESDIWQSVGGRQIPALASGQRPAFVADAGHGGGAAAVQCSVTGSRALRQTSFATLVAGGTKPVLIARARWRALAANARMLDNFDGVILRSLTHRLDVSQLFSFTDTTTVNVTAASNTATHTFSGWADGVNANLRVDGTASAAATTLFLDSAWNCMSVGCLHSSGLTNFGDVSLWAIVVLSQYDATIVQRIERLLADRFPA